MKAAIRTLRTLFLVLASLAPAHIAAAQSAGERSVKYHNESVCVLPGVHSDAFTSRKFAKHPERHAKASAEIQITFVTTDASHPWPQAAQDAVRMAADIWEHHISSPVTLYVKAFWDDIGGPLAAGGPASSASDFPGAVPDTRYPLALYRTMTGEALPPPSTLPLQADMVITFNRTANWSYATDGTPVAGHFDLVSVSMHEIGHGLGFIGSESYSEGMGAVGDPPLIFDRFVRDGAGHALLDETVYPNPSADIGNALTGEDIHFAGGSTQSNTGAAAALFAPPSWIEGSSYSHLDYATYPPGNINSLMNPYYSTAEVQHTPGPAACGMLADIGWPLGDDCLNALPVELTDFDAVLSGRVVLLQWRTMSENDNAGFEVQHREMNGTFWPVGFVGGAGTTTTPSDYEFAIPGLGPGRHLFRLKQVDSDGTFDYSPEVELALPVPGHVFVEGPYPEPFTTSTSIGFSVRRSQPVSVDLFDVLGRKVRRVFQGTAQPEAATNVSIEAADLPAGSYIFVIRGEDFTKSGVVHRI